MAVGIPVAKEGKMGESRISTEEVLNCCAYSISEVWSQHNMPGVSHGERRSRPVQTHFRCSAGSAPGTAGGAGASGSRSLRTPVRCL